MIALNSVDWSQLLANVVVISLAIGTLYKGLTSALDKRLEAKLNEKLGPVSARLDSHMLNEEVDAKKLTSQIKRSVKLQKEHMALDTIAFDKIDKKFDQRSQEFQQIALTADRRLQALEQHRRSGDDWDGIERKK